MKQRKIPQRKCVLCQKMLTKKAMVRLVRTPEGEVELDLTGKKNGRGVYMCGSLDGFQKARKTKLFERALKVPIAAEAYDRLETQFVQLNEKYRFEGCGKGDDEG